MRILTTVLILGLLGLGCDAERAPTGSAAGSTAPGAAAAGGALGGIHVSSSVPAFKGSVVACAGLPLRVVDDHGDGARDATPLQLGQSGQGQLESTADADWFAVDLEGGRRYRLSAHGLVPLGLALVSPAGRGDVAAADPGAADLDLVAPADGVYFVRLNSPAGAPSPLAYTIVCAPQP